MPRAKTDKKAEVKETTAAPARKPAAKKAVEVVDVPQPEVVEVGRFYELTFPHRTVWGELVETKKNQQHIDVWSEGKPGAESLVTDWSSIPVREIGRETCFELSHSLMAAQ